MSKYSSLYFNSEKYFDPTAGKALTSLIREERKTYESIKIEIIESKSDRIKNFARLFSSFYSETFGPRSNGKPRRFSKFDVIRDQLQIYEYCMDHVNDPDFSIKQVVEIFHLGTDIKVKQIFNGRGQINKLISSYKEWLVTKNIRWNITADEES